MEKSMTIAYRVHGGLYVNLTNRCPCACTFCVRQGADGVHGTPPLWLEHEPDFDEVRAALVAEEGTPFSELVFCGYGEPTEALGVLLQTAEFAKGRWGIPVRINTNGLGNLVNGRDITPLFAGKIDVLSVSLNSSDPEIYRERVRPKFGADAYPALIDFVERARAFVPRIVLTTVGTTITPADESACRALCARLGVEYRIRTFMPPDPA